MAEYEALPVPEWGTWEFYEHLLDQPHIDHDADFNDPNGVITFRDLPGYREQFMPEHPLKKPR